MTLTLYISSIVICDPLAAIHLFDLRNNNLSVCLLLPPLVLCGFSAVKICSRTEITW